MCENQVAPYALLTLYGEYRAEPADLFTCYKAEVKFCFVPPDLGVPPQTLSVHRACLGWADFLQKVYLVVSPAWLSVHAARFHYSMTDLLSACLLQAEFSPSPRPTACTQRQQLAAMVCCCCAVGETQEAPPWVMPTGLPATGMDDGSGTQRQDRCPLAGISMEQSLSVTACTSPGVLLEEAGW